MSEPLEMSLVKDRLEEARAQAALYALVAELQSSRPPLRVRLGLGLARFGEWMAGGAATANGHADTATASVKR